MAFIKVRSHSGLNGKDYYYYLNVAHILCVSHANDTEERGCIKVVNGGSYDTYYCMESPEEVIKMLDPALAVTPKSNSEKGKKNGKVK